MKKTIAAAALFLLCAFGIAGCRKETAADVQIYYVDVESEALTTEGCDWPATDSREQAAFVLKKMREPEDSVKCNSAIPSDVKLLEWSLEESVVELSFSDEYTLMDAPGQLLLQAALVESLTQVPGVESVCMKVNGEPLIGHDGAEITSLSKEDFLIDTEEAFYKEERHEPIEESDVEEVEEMK